MQEHHVEVKRTARYFTLGEISDSLRQVWFVCHGYGHLANYFLERFEALDNGRRLIVAPEALSRFYLQGFSGRVGASWMTREDRLLEIEDYTSYLDAVYAAIFNRVDRDTVSVHALGFSQGTATVARWLAGGKAKVDQLILWAGLLPPDLDFQKTARIFMEANLHLVVGQQDEYAQDQVVSDQKSRLQEHGIPFKFITFDGGHELDQAVLVKLAQIPT